MRVVIDTNVVVSAILRDRLPEKILLFVLGHPDFEWVASGEILAEYREVLRRPKFALPDPVLSEWDERFRSAVAEWPVEISVSFPRDVKDAKFLACALAAEADFFITGDHDFTEARKLEHTKIISVNQFNELVCQPLS
ncbi:MAG: putative toxin-antitoxin system toxin component, PIN family [Verrucomicrobiales bacterium]|nr:putative toxin-antitoxin system toxin component, PIN family [Verrucomicrobiales bacterium]